LLGSACESGQGAAKEEKVLVLAEKMTTEVVFEINRKNGGKRGKLADKKKCDDPF